MKERPIIFTKNIDKILDGTKTQTRRVIKPQPAIEGFMDNYGELAWYWKGGRRLLNAGYGADYVHTDKDSLRKAMVLTCPYGQVGDGLWVRERHKLEKIHYADGWWVKASYPFPYHDVGYRWFKWDDIPKSQRKRLARIKTWDKWRSSRFMYHFLARIFTEITGIRVERQLDITLEDAIKEGFGSEREFNEAFLKLNPHLKAENPWVWAISFKK